MKKILAFFLLCLLFIPLAGCGGDDKNTLYFLNFKPEVASVYTEIAKKIQRGNRSNSPCCNGSIRYVRADFEVGDQQIGCAGPVSVEWCNRVFSMEGLLCRSVRHGDLSAFVRSVACHSFRRRGVRNPGRSGRIWNPVQQSHNGSLFCIAEPIDIVFFHGRDQQL